MFNFRSIFSKSSFFLISLGVLSSPVFAGTTGGTINYTINAANAIPTLSGTMLIVLSMLLFLVAFRVSKSKTGGKFLVMTFGTAALTLSVGGIKVVSTVEAGGPSAIVFNASGMAPIPASPSGFVTPYLFENQDFPTGITITSVVPEPGFLCGANYLNRVSNQLFRPIETLSSREIIKTPIIPRASIGRCGEIGFPEGNVGKRITEDNIYTIEEPDGVNIGLGNACGITCGPDLSGPENTLEACTDNFDNDGDGSVDRLDENCDGFVIQSE